MVASPVVLRIVRSYCRTGYIYQRLRSSPLPASWAELEQFLIYEIYNILIDMQQTSLFLHV